SVSDVVGVPRARTVAGTHVETSRGAGDPSAAHPVPAPATAPSVVRTHQIKFAASAVPINEQRPDPVPLHYQDASAGTDPAVVLAAGAQTDSSATELEAASALAEQQAGVVQMMSLELRDASLRIAALEEERRELQSQVSALTSALQESSTRALSLEKA